MKHIAAAIGLAAAGIMTINHVRTGGDAADKAGRVVEAFCGFNPAHELAWRPQFMVFTIPAAAGVAVSMIASKSGMNRYTPKGINI